MQSRVPNTEHDCHLQFNVDAEAFRNATSMRAKRGLALGWASIMYDGFNNVWPYCSITMKRNYLSSNSKPTKTPYWTANAVCRTDQCIGVKFIVQDMPTVDATTVTVKAHITGVCRHLEPNDASTDILANRHQLAGKKS